MRDIGIDVSDAVSKQLTEEMVARADLVVYLAEQENAPPYVGASGSTLFLSIPDPATMDHAEHVETRERVREAVSNVLALMNRGRGQRG